MKVSIGQQIDEVERELGQRRSVYPRLVSSGKLRSSIAEYQIKRMEAVLESLRWLADNEAQIKQRLAP